MDIKSTEFFKNIKILPTKNTSEYDQLIDWEIQKCVGGVNVNGVILSGWLYWHLNHWHIRVDGRDNFGNSVRLKSLPELRDNEWIRAEHLENCRIKQKGYLEVGGRQTAKALLNSSQLYTATGEIEIGSCNIGDRIYDESGKLTTIIGKYPQGVRPVYEMTLIDGRKLYCDLDHRWKVHNRFKRTNKEEVKTTRELLENFKRIRPSWVDKRENAFEYTYSIHNNQAVEYSEKELTLEPYFLGLWLGDGSNTYSKITTIDKEIEDYIRDYAERIGLQVTIDDVDTFMVTSGSAVGKSGLKREGRNFVHTYLQSLYNNKHIPEEYMYGSIEQRMELLRGLMDSDGSCTEKSGNIEFSSSIPRLAEDFYKLCRGLGINILRNIKPSFYKKDGVRVKCKDSHRFRLYTDKKVFKLSRKLERIKTNPKYLNKTAIVDIRYVYDAETTCIVVDNESHLFLTDNYTVTHNSEGEASFSGYNAQIFENTQNLIIGGNDNDIVLLKDKVDFGFKYLWDGIAIPRLDKTWKSNSIRLGYKQPSGDDKVWSTLVIRNSDDGKNTEVAAGTTAKSFIMDEVGKYSFGKVFEAAKPALKSDDGWRAIPMLVGTGGAFDKGADAERFFYNPEANDFLGIVDEETGKTTGLFLSGLYRKDCKFKTTLKEYLIKEGKIADGAYPDLEEISILVSDKEKARAKILEERERKKRDPDQTEYLKVIMYDPLTPDECFLTDSDNIFNVAAAKAQQNRLYDNNIQGEYVFLEFDGNKIIPKKTHKRPLSQFPHKQNDDKDCPIIIWEHPMPNPPRGLYVGGVDSFRYAKTKYSNSLGTVYIFKRMHNLLNEGYQDTFVACYSAKPEDKDKWNEQARLLIEYYNAETLVENDEASFIEYMKAQKKQGYLAKCPPLIKEIAPQSPNRDYGISRSSERIRDHLNGTFKSYLNSKLTPDEYNEDGTIMRYGITAVNNVRDAMLLEEIMKYNEIDNFDRIIGAQLAVFLADSLNPLYKVSSQEDPRLEELYRRRSSPSVFGPSNYKSLSRGNIKKLFG